MCCVSARIPHTSSTLLPKAKALSWSRHHLWWLSLLQPLGSDLQGWAHLVFHYWAACFPENSLPPNFYHLQHAPVQTANPALPLVRSPAAQLAVYQYSHHFEELIWPPSTYGEGCLLVEGFSDQNWREKAIPGHPHTREETPQWVMAQNRQQVATQKQLQEDCQINLTQTSLVLATNCKKSSVKS